MNGGERMNSKKGLTFVAATLAGITAISAVSNLPDSERKKQKAAESQEVKKDLEHARKSLEGDPMRKDERVLKAHRDALEDLLKMPDKNLQMIIGGKDSRMLRDATNSKFAKTYAPISTSEDIHKRGVALSMSVGWFDRTIEKMRKNRGVSVEDFRLKAQEQIAEVNILLQEIEKTKTQ